MKRRLPLLTRFRTMPKFTNKFGIHPILVRAIERNFYDPGESDITTTQLIDQPQVVALKKMFRDEIVEDVSDLIWILVGSAVHVILERAAGDDVISEKRYYTESNGWKVGGQVDMIDGKTLYDFKVTSVWNYVYDDHKKYENQANVNRFILSKNGVEIDKVENILILRDWIKSKSVKEKSGGKYPQVQVQTIELPKWPLDGAEKVVHERVKAHQEAQKLTPEELAQRFPCSSEDRWYNPKTKIFTRCKSFCPVSRFCKQNQTNGI